MSRFTLVSISAVLITVACSKTSEDRAPARAAATGRANPFFTASTLQYQAPPFDRIKDASYEYRFAGENLAFGDKGIKLTAIMKLWMASESHRKNILFPEFTQIGIGIARAKNGDLYFTQVFAKPAE